MAGGDRHALVSRWTLRPRERGRDREPQRAPAAEDREHPGARPYDLIVMSTHARTGVSRLVVGSIAEEVLRRAPCPVLTVHLPPGAAP